MTSSDAFVARLREVGESRYHHRHPFHVAMHEGTLGPAQLRHWVANRFYYQTRIPLKDALILAKSESAEFRRTWLRRIREQDGDGASDGGLELWLRLAEAVGLDRGEVIAHRRVVPGVRFACDDYVSSVARWSLLEAVASSLTECFAPDLMRARAAAWERHYPWIGPGGTAYFRARIGAARRDADEALSFVAARAITPELQEQCVAALERKTDILWHVVESIATTCEET
ncbi:pyrroloquinoline-quinone synthase PqqC [Sandaracinus amylolyticus]|uniref:Pyrroloquinoline-quinone synthase n=1 Tax=Sandaracinus amylolyticus TaxID=927083 RepID=A0A0F6SDY5_9BACT|nr:pyrroloquinoline-quinone synthase PqqC [Sandaracinus amylolyticus]AKF04254.1 Pyrroloquinoline-quinone synthase [Sandaracinus amylolyticus]